MRALLIVAIVILGSGRAHAQGEGSAAGSAVAAPEHHQDGSGSGAASEGSGSAAAEHHDQGSGSATAPEGSGSAAASEHHEEGSGSATAAEHHDGSGSAAVPEHPTPPVAHPEGEEPAPIEGSEDEDGEIVTNPFDEDGDGKLEPEELADKAEFEADFKDIPNEPDEAALEQRPEAKNLMPSLTIEQFQKLVKIARKVVLEKMEAKAVTKNAKRMKTFAYMVGGVSLLGIFILFMPLGLAKKYPGKGGTLFKYAALAAVTFFITVNLFGGVLLVLRTTQGALSGLTSPGVAIAAGTFDTLSDKAEDYVVMGKEMFGPTLEHLAQHADQDPVVVILENGMKVVKDAKVFLSVAKMFKKVKFALDYVPIVLFIITLILFFRAIWPTLREIILLPARAASGEVTGGEVVKSSLRRVVGELKATLCTIGVLAILTLVSSLVLSEVVKPAIAGLLEYFALSLNYLMFVKGSSSGLVFMALFGVILFLILNLATLIVSMTFFLGKSQKIFQARFNEGTPLSTHARFFKWGTPSVLWVQVFPWLFVIGASQILFRINHAITGGALDASTISWTQLLLAGPLFLVVAYLIVFWAARGLKAIRFLQAYKVKVPGTPSVTKSA